ncbi:lipoteichoic acid stability factor AuxA [Staphylococcus sp. AS1337]|uniref:lipoteichoic acid stability factor AuxA n=1 Tax=Staphylococcus sp. AS1337 TaxID=3434042 RepID=UPI003F5490BF
MSFLKKHAEILYSYIIGIVSLFTGLIILINLPLIDKLNNKGKIDLHIHNVWDFINAFFGEIIRVISNYIGNFPVFSAIIIILFGIGVVLLGFTLFRTTRYDYDISIFFLVIGILFFIITLILMTQVYSFFAIIFVIPFAIHIGYIVYKDELNTDHRKYHYLWIIFSYGFSYLITQIVLYGRIDSDEIIPIDILSVNTFFIIMWLLGQMSIWNFLFLRRSLPLTKQELGEEEPELSRTSKGTVTNQTKETWKNLQDKTTEFTRKTRRSVDIQKARDKKDKFITKWKDKIDIQEDDIPNWMKIPKWVKSAYVELFCGAVLLFFTLIEFNNRNSLFVSGNWEISQTQYVIEWITLLILMFIIIIYILTTLTNFLKDRFYYLQLFMVSLLFFKLLTEFVNIMVHGLLLSIFITPILLIMLIAIVVAFVMKLREPSKY